MENQLFLVDKIRLRSYMVNKSYGRLGLSSHHECKRDVAQLAKIVSAVVLIWMRNEGLCTESIRAI